MTSDRPLTLSLTVTTPPREAFEEVAAALRDHLGHDGVAPDARRGSRIEHAGRTLGRVLEWEPGQRICLEWHPATWGPEVTMTIDVRFEAVPSGTAIQGRIAGWEGVLADEGSELAAWFGARVLAPVFDGLSPVALGDWLTDRMVRRPTGPRARRTYADPTFHWPNFLLILDRIALRADDNLLEVGCGGGAFLHRALESGCRATAVDHSPEMVALATRQNAAAITAGRLTVLQAEADQLPVADGAFTCAVMTGVIGFLPDPVRALKEIHRSLRPGGRIAIFAGTAVLRGTPAAPEPFASRIRFYEKAELESVGRDAGFAEVRVEEPDLTAFAREARVPAEAMEMFGTRGGALLLTGRRSG
jgi:SAM-dependent methyltransferase